MAALGEGDANEGAVAFFFPDFVHGVAGVGEGSAFAVEFERGGAEVFGGVGHADEEAGAGFDGDADAAGVVIFDGVDAVKFGFNFDGRGSWSWAGAQAGIAPSEQSGRWCCWRVCLRSAAGSVAG